MNIDALLSDRARAVPSSGIRRIVDAGRKMPDPIDLSVGQPDFPVPQAVCDAAIAAIRAGKNGYAISQGDPTLLAGIAARLRDDIGWTLDPAATGSGTSALVTAGTSGALVLAFQALLSPGDECVIPDPYFVSYPQLAAMAGARAVLCDTYPDFRMTAERVERVLSPRTKFVLLNSPSNPAGTVLTQPECRDLLDLCRRRGVVLISDEIYDEFCFPDFATARTAVGGRPACPSPAREPGSEADVLVIRGFGKTYGCTGWRLGYAAGPRALLSAMTRLHQYTFVCAPTPLQVAGAACFGVDMAPTVREYVTRRDEVIRALSPLTDLPTPGGAFYAFFRVPERLGLTARGFVERCMARSLLVVPGGEFSGRDTHVRLSFAAPIERVRRGLGVLTDLMRA